MSRKRGRDFDPVASLNELIADLQAKTGIRIDGEPGGECQSLIDRATAASADFRRGLMALHQAEGHSSGVEVLFRDFERVARRAVQLAAEHGAAPAGQSAPQATAVPAEGGASACADAARPLIGHQVTGSNV